MCGAWCAYCGSVRQAIEMSLYFVLEAKAFLVVGVMVTCGDERYHVSLLVIYSVCWWLVWLSGEGLVIILISYL